MQQKNNLHTRYVHTTALYHYVRLNYVLPCLRCDISCLSVGCAGPHPVLTMLEAAQPVLNRILSSPGLQANAALVSAVCEV